MPKTEREILAEVLLAGTSSNTRLWRNNSGSLLDRHGRLVRFGIANPGGSDCIGITSVLITPDMIGRRIGIFTAIEVKREIGGTVSEEQEAFLRVIEMFGGISGVVRSSEEARALLGIACTPR